MNEIVSLTLMDTLSIVMIGMEIWLGERRQETWWVCIIISKKEFHGLLYFNDIYDISFTEMVLKKENDFIKIVYKNKFAHKFIELSDLVHESSNFFVWSNFILQILQSIYFVMYKNCIYKVNVSIYIHNFYFVENQK